MENNSGKYDDIIDLPRPVSAKRAKMTNYDRAAQFSPFAALTGYDSVIRETGRLTDARIELGEDGKAMLDRALCWVREHLASRPPVAMLVFQPDEWKLGGEYVRLEGRAVKIDEYHGTISLDTGEVVRIDSIFEIECGLGQEEL